MTRFRCLCSVLLLALAAGSAHAGLCTIDDVPAATLLLPYFEVDLAHPNGTTTLFSVNNSAATARLVQVTLWTDWAIPTLRFSVYLTGFDIQTVNVRDLFNGSLPRTAPDSLDPTDLISPQGELSQDVSFAGCTALGGDLTALEVDELRRAHGGLDAPSFGGCVGEKWPDDHVRGYVTLDVVNDCSDLTPADPAYYQGVLGSANVLWGKVFQIDPENGAARGESLVAIEACPASVSGQPDPCSFGDGDYTFYARYVGASGADRREPLPMVFQTSFLNGGSFAGGAELTVWRDTKKVPPGLAGPRSCSGSPKLRPDWWPLYLTEWVAFDESENVAHLCFQGENIVPIGRDWACLPLATQHLALDEIAPEGDEHPVPWSFGMFHLHLNQRVPTGAESDFARSAQAWISADLTALDQYSVGFAATHLDDLCQPDASDSLILIP
jgi:hypothetical protein